MKAFVLAIALLMPLTAMAQTTGSTTVGASSTASLVTPSGQTITVQNQTVAAVQAVLAGFVLTVTAPSGTVIIAVPTCDRPTGQLNALRCDYSALSQAPNPLPIVDANRPIPTPTPPQPSCPVSGPCTFTLYGGQSIAIGSFTLAVGPSYLSVMAVYDGTALTVTAGGPSESLQLDSLPDADCRELNGVANRIRCSNPHGSLRVVSLLANPAAATCTTGDLPTGWNLIAGGQAQELTSNIGPLYTYQTGDSDYLATQPNSDLPVSAGYWAYFDQPAEVGLGCTRPLFLQQGHVPPAMPATLVVPAGWSMIGLAAGAVTGADLVLVYDPASGQYQQTDNLKPGQGAWVYSAAGGTISITPAQ